MGFLLFRLFLIVMDSAGWENSFRGYVMLTSLEKMRLTA
jgi:hypothetical protein